MDMNDFLDRSGLSFQCESAQGKYRLRPDDMPSHYDYFACTFRREMQEMPFRLGYEKNRGFPSAEDAMRYLGWAAVEYESCDDYLDWAEENFLDPNDDGTDRAFTEIRLLSQGLSQLLSPALYGELCREIEIEMAVEITLEGMARRPAKPRQT